MSRFPKLGTSLNPNFRNSYNEGIDKIDAELDFQKQFVEDEMEQQKQRVDNLITEAEQPSEVVDARGNHTILRDRLDSTDAQLAQIAINVKKFGAVGDGVADDTQAFSDATSHLNTLGGGILYIPQGVYKLSGIVNVYSNTHVKGSGIGSTIIHTTDAGNDYQYVFYAQGSSENHLSNVSISDITLDPDPIPSRTSIKFYNVLRFNYVTNLQIFNIESKRSHDFISMTEVEDFTIRNITSSNNNSAIISMFSGTKKGFIEKIRGYNVVEVIDFFNNEDITARDLIAVGRLNDGEALDMSSSRRITIKDSKFDSFYNGALMKIEEDIPFDGYTLDNCEFTNFTNAGVRTAISVGDPLVYDEVCQNVTLSNSKILSAKPSTIGFECFVTQKVKNYTLSNNEISVEGRGIRFSGNHENAVLYKNNSKSSAEEAIYVSGASGIKCLNPIIENNEMLTLVNKPAMLIDTCLTPTVYKNRVKSNGDGISIKNVSRPLIQFNEISEAGGHGISFQITSVEYLSAEGTFDLLLINNVVSKFGASANYRSGIRIDINLGTDETGTYNLMNVINNVIKDDLSNPNTTYGVLIAKGSLTGLDYVTLTNNTIFNTTVGINGLSHLLTNSVKEGNLIKTK